MQDENGTMEVKLREFIQDIRKEFFSTLCFCL